MLDTDNEYRYVHLIRIVQGKKADPVDAFARVHVHSSEEGSYAMASIMRRI